MLRVAHGGVVIRAHSQRNAKLRNADLGPQRGTLDVFIYAVLLVAALGPQQEKIYMRQKHIRVFTGMQPGLPGPTARLRSVGLKSTCC